jgi:hypothetical protein
MNHLVGEMRGAIVDHGFVDGIGSLVWEDARGEARYTFGDLKIQVQYGYKLSALVVDVDVCLVLFVAFCCCLLLFSV